MLNHQALKELVVDLRNPPSGFPRFNFNYNFFIDEDGKTYGDLTAYVASRALKTPKRIPQFLVDGGDLFLLFMQSTGLSLPDAKRLVYPGELVNSRHDLSEITGEHMSIILQQFIDRGAVNYGPLIAYLNHIDETVDAHAERHTPQGIRDRVNTFLRYYGDDTKAW